jgi:hypothetical protein
MSVQINCDRCGKPTKGWFVDAQIIVKRGVFSSVYSKIPPVSPGHNWVKHWQLCEDCTADLKRWTEPGTKVVYEVDLDVKENAA